MVNISNLLFNYGRKQPPLFENLDCQLQPGSIVGLLGKNGAGKTTTIRILGTLLRATSGIARVAGYYREHRGEVRRQGDELGDIK